VRGGTPLGVAKRRRTAQFARSADGRLTVVEHYRERGLGFFIIPFSDHLAWRMVLDSASVCAEVG